MDLVNTPITKFILIVTATSSILVQSSKLLIFGEKLPAFLDLCSKAFVFRHTGELIFGGYLVYYFRVLERHAGSRSYGGCICVISALTYALQLALTPLGIAFPSGPYPLIFGGFVPFTVDVPPTQSFLLFGWRFTDKVFIYIAGLQLLLTAPKKAAAVGLVSITSALLVRQNVFGLQHFKLPGAVVRIMDKVFGFLGRPAPHRAAPRNRAQGPPAGGQPPPAAATAPARVVASEEAVGQLVAMGFSQERAVSALQQTNNNVEQALAYLV